MLAPDVEASDLKAAIHEMTGAMRPAPPSVIFALLSEMTTLCRRPSWVGDGESTQLYIAGLAKALQDYPEDILRAGIEQWRRVPISGEWWPAEGQLHALMRADIEGRAALLDELEAAAKAQEPKGAQRSTAPVGKTASYVEAVRFHRGGAYVRAYLCGGILCMFTADTVYAAPTAARVLMDETGHLARKHGVRIERCWECQQMGEAHRDKFMVDPPGR